MPDVDNQVPTTRPLLGAIPAKLTEGFAAIAQRFEANDQRPDGIDKRPVAPDTELAEFRVETGKSFRIISNKFTILTGQVLGVQARQKDPENRPDDLERKAS